MSEKHSARQLPGPANDDLDDLEERAELEELARLKAEVQDLREVNEILAEATGFFADHLDSRSQEP